MSEEAVINTQGPSRRPPRGPFARLVWGGIGILAGIAAAVLIHRLTSPTPAEGPGRAVGAFPSGLTLLELPITLEPEIALDLGDNTTLSLVLVRPGTLRLSEASGKPRTLTVLRPFYIGRTELTLRQFQAVLRRGPGRWYGKPNEPACTMSFATACAFCVKASEVTGRTLRLPTEDEWEYSCRAGTTTAYSTGDGTDGVKSAAWSSATKRGFEPSEVAKLSPNAWGLYDVHGNVSEWCLASGVPGSLALEKVTDTTTTPKVLWGGTFRDPPERCRSDSRQPVDFSDGWVMENAGLRVVMEPGPARTPKPLPPRPTPADAETNFTARVEDRLKSGGTLDDLVSDRGTWLHEAAWQGYLKAVQMLLDRGADVNSSSNRLSYTPLHWAVVARRKDVVELLLARGAKVNVRGSEDFTPLHLAAMNGDVEIAKLLVEKGADVNAPMRDTGWTPLWFAAEGRNRNEELVKLLKAAGGRQKP